MNTVRHAIFKVFLNFSQQCVIFSEGVLHVFC